MTNKTAKDSTDINSETNEISKQESDIMFECQECGMNFGSLKGLRIHCGKKKHELQEEFKVQEGGEIKKKMKHMPAGVYEGVPYEAIHYEGKPAFLTMNEHGKLIIIPVLPGEEPGTIICPMVGITPEYHFDSESLEFFNNWEPNPLELYEAIYEEFDTYFFLEPRYKALISIQTLESYIQHKLMTTSYLYVEGTNETGKSHILFIQNYLCYRAVLTFEATPASIWTFLDQHPTGCTILEDEAQELNNKNCPQKMRMYRSGYQRGPGVLQVKNIDKDGNRTLAYFRVFGCKMFAGTFMPSDQGLRERFIRIPITTGIPDKDEFVIEDSARFHEIRLKLLVWRLKTYNEPLRDIELPIGLKGRQKELWKPKLLAAAGLPVEATITKLTLEYTELRRREWASRLEAYICRAIIAAYLEFGSIGVTNFGVIWKWLVYLFGREVTNAQSIETTQFGKVSKRLLGFRLKSIFNGKNVGRSAGETVYSFEEDRLLRTGKRFSIIPPEVNSLSEIDKTTILEQKVALGITEASDEVENTAQPEEPLALPYFDSGQEEAALKAEQVEILYKLNHPSSLPSHSNEDGEEPPDPSYYPEEKVDKKSKPK